MTAIGKRKHLNGREEKTLPRMRTIDQAAEWLRATDPDTAFTRTALRRLVTTGELPSVRIGQKYLISLETLEEYLQGSVPLSVSVHGIREVKQ